MQNKFSISTAIAYVNGPPHIGHAFEFIQADSIARFHRLCGDDVYFLTGTDEHGSKIYELAQKESVDVRTLVDRNAQKFIDFTAQFNISNNDFIRTSDQKKHWPSVTKLWNKLVEKGDIYKGIYSGLYCVGCEAYILETELADGNCPTHLKPPAKLQEENYFFRLSKYSNRIADLIRSREVRIVPEIRENEMLALCERGLEDVSFSRAKESLPWGIPVPDDPAQVMYVWCDALTNYISALDYANEGPLYQKYWPVDCHVIGKDILRFHAGIWIGMLLSAGVSLPKSELIHGHVLDADGKKMSKSLGNVADPAEVANYYGVDEFRYFLLSSVPSTDDGNFSYSLLESKINSDLANNLGNFVNRVFTLAEKYCNSRVPKVVADHGLDLDVRIVANKLSEYFTAFKAYDHKAASEILVRLVDYGNNLISTHEPWKLAKSDEASKVNALVRHIIEIVLHVAFMLEPFCPSKSVEILKCLGLQDELKNGFRVLPTLIDKVGEIKKGQLLFARIESDRSQADRDHVEVQLPQIPLPVTEGAQNLQLPAVQFVLSDLKHIGTGIQKRLKKEWRQWIEDLKNRPSEEQFRVEEIIQRAYDLNASLGVGPEEVPGNALVQKYLQGPTDDFPFVNPIVALYNYVEAKYGLSVGVHDVQKLKGDVILKICDGSEQYLPLGEAKLKPVPSGTYAYCDDEGQRVICWLEVKQIQETAVTDKTSHALFLLQGYEGMPLSYVQEAADELRSLVLEWLGQEKPSQSHQPKPAQKLASSTLVIGEITSVKKHEKKEHISICQVDIGIGTKTIVCGGPNVQVGLKVVVALPGQVMLEYRGSGEVAYTVEARKSYGTVSEAVICAPEEVGVNEPDDAKKPWVIEMDASVPVGTPYEQVKDKIVGP